MDTGANLPRLGIIPTGFARIAALLAGVLAGILPVLPLQSVISLTLAAPTVATGRAPLPEVVIHIGG
jgi:hypothetical protein